MTAILLCGYRRSDSGEILGLARMPDGRTLIDTRIREMRAMGFHVICVLAGQTADEQLRTARSIADCELVFDTNEDESTLATNTKAGLAATDGEGCFVFPIEVPMPATDVWMGLREAYRREGFYTKVSVFQSPANAPCHYGFPLLVTRTGNARVKELTDFTQLTDPRLTYFQPFFSALATPSLPL